MQGKELSNAVTASLKSVNLLADKAADKLVSSYRSARIYLESCLVFGHIPSFAR